MCSLLEKQTNKQKHTGLEVPQQNYIRKIINWQTNDNNYVKLLNVAQASTFEIFLVIILASIWNVLPEQKRNQASAQYRHK